MVDQGWTLLPGSDSSGSPGILKMKRTVAVAAKCIISVSCKYLEGCLEWNKCSTHLQCLVLVSSVRINLSILAVVSKLISSSSIFYEANEDNLNNQGKWNEEIILFWCQTIEIVGRVSSDELLMNSLKTFLTHNFRYVFCTKNKCVFEFQFPRMCWRMSHAMIILLFIQLICLKI